MDKDLEVVKTDLFQRLNTKQKVDWFFREYLEKPRGYCFTKEFVSRALKINRGHIKNLTGQYKDKILRLSSNFTLYGNKKDIEKIKNLILWV